MRERPIEPNVMNESPEKWAEIAMWESDRADKAETENAQLREMVKVFLRAPSVGSDGPGSHTIVVQDFNLREARRLVRGEIR